VLISVIIPTRNRASLLSQSLEFLREQRLMDDIGLEVIVADDGSTDDTPAIVKDYRRSWERLVYVQSEDRHAAGNPSTARNAGLQIAQGTLVIFLDCGVVVPRDFVQTLVRRYRASAGHVVLLPIVYGLFAVQSHADVQAVDGVAPSTLDEVISQISQYPEWRERREGWYALVDDELERLPAPWSAAWTVAMAAPKTLIDGAGGFDETFKGWGAEDIDLGYRLHRQACEFVVVRDTYALHLPHPLGDVAEKTRHHRVNLKKMHQKYCSLATEVLPFYPGIFVNYVLQWLNNLPLSVILPHYAANDLQVLNRQLLQGHGQVLISGVDDLVVAGLLTASHHFAHNLSTQQLLTKNFPERQVDYLLGVNVPYPDRHFDVVLCTDAVRLYPPEMTVEFFRECHRIGKTVYLAWKPDHCPPLAHVPWLSPAALDDCLRRTGAETRTVLALTTFQVDQLLWQQADSDAS
jgi:glycosyltransferase involved in cell wall biosynthesis